jgi:hypothetical protein
MPAERLGDGGDGEEQVGRRVSRRSSVSSASKRRASVIVAPARMAGVVWILRPPTWNIGRTVKT